MIRFLKTIRDLFLFNVLFMLQRRETRSFYILISTERAKKKNIIIIKKKFHALFFNITGSIEMKYNTSFIYDTYAYDIYNYDIK